LVAQEKCYYAYRPEVGASYVGLTLFNGSYSLKLLGVSGTGVTEGGSGSRATTQLSDPPSAAGRRPDLTSSLLVRTSSRNHAREGTTPLPLSRGEL